MARKYRPYFTLAELRVLESEVSTHSLKRYLYRFIRDIDEGFIDAAITVVDPIEVQLGMRKGDDKTAYEKEQNRRYLADEMSPVEEQEYLLKQGVVLPS